MKVTIAKVNAALAELGVEERLVKGAGYFYFWEGRAPGWYASSVYVSRINDLTLEQWLQEYHNLAANSCDPETLGACEFRRFPTSSEELHLFVVATLMQMFDDSHDLVSGDDLFFKVLRELWAIYPLVDAATVTGMVEAAVGEMNDALALSFLGYTGFEEDEITEPEPPIPYVNRMYGELCKLAGISNDNLSMWAAGGGQLHECVICGAECDDGVTLSFDKDDYCCAGPCAGEN